MYKRPNETLVCCMCREVQTWNGRLTELLDFPTMLPSDMLERRRTVNVTNLEAHVSPLQAPRGLFSTMSTIDLNVDFKQEIEPQLGRLIGRGGFGRVYECTWRGQKAAVKILDTLDSDDTLKSVMKVRGAAGPLSPSHNMSYKLFFSIAIILRFVDIICCSASQHSNFGAIRSVYHSTVHGKYQKRSPSHAIELIGRWKK